MNRGPLRLLRAAPLLLTVLLGAAAARPRHHHRHPAPGRSVSEASPWHSPEACRSALSHGKRKPRDPGVARIGTWNVRWFPDGVPGNGRDGSGKPTDLDWLSCAIAWLDTDVLVLEEVKSTPRAAEALAALTRSLDALSGGHHHVEVDRCPGAGRQSVAFLYDDRRVVARSFHNVDSLNPSGHACDEHLRPGFSGYFRFPGGGDLHVVAVHFKSGVETRAYGLRRASMAGLSAAYRDLEGTEADSDVLVTGDFNTMGCDDCSPKIRAEQEVATVSTEVTSVDPAFRRVGSDYACSEYYRGIGNLLDHFLVTRSMQEAPAGERSHVEGYCAEVSCSRLSQHQMPRAYEELSDHCPVVFDLEDRDLDTGTAVSTR